MLKLLSEITMPSWLMDLTPATMMSESFPLYDVLRDSLYYPSSGFDGDPVRRLAGNILSFVYVDYGYDQDECMSALKEEGFTGYDLIATRSVTERELTPNGYHPLLLFPSDGNPLRYREEMKKPFCYWSLFQRSESVPVSHGPFRFSLLYLCSDGVAAYQALYVGNSVTPKAVAVIQPGHAAFGHNWTNYTDSKQIFARIVLGNPNGQPEFMLYGGNQSRYAYRRSCWPSYRKFIRFVDRERNHGSISLWRRSVQ